MEVNLTPDTALQTVSVAWSIVEVVLALAAVVALAGSARILRTKGVRAAAFPFLIYIALTIAIGSAAEGVSAALNAPIFFDLIIWGVVLVACLIFGFVIHCLCPNLKTGAVLAVLGLSPLCFLPQRAAIKPVVETGLSAVASVAMTGGKVAGRTTPTPKQVQSGAEAVATTTRTALKADQIGWIGETATVWHIRAMDGFRDLKSKFHGNHGFDAVFEHVEDGKSVIYVVETKTNKAVLSPGQMTDEWIASTVDKMATAKNAQVRQTGVLVKKARDEGRLKRLLSEVSLDEKTITLTHLDEAGKKVAVWSKASAAEVIDQATKEVVRPAAANVALAPAA